MTTPRAPPLSAPPAVAPRPPAWPCPPVSATRLPSRYPHTTSQPSDEGEHADPRHLRAWSGVLVFSWSSHRGDFVPGSLAATWRSATIARALDCIARASLCARRRARPQRRHIRAASRRHQPMPSSRRLLRKSLVCGGTSIASSTSSLELRYRHFDVDQLLEVVPREGALLGRFLDPSFAVVDQLVLVQQLVVRQPLDQLLEPEADAVLDLRAGPSRARRCKGRRSRSS